MSDFHPDDTFLRASAYLDGELDAAETARAEADPAVMAEVELIRALQSELRDVEPFDPRARERAITAALAEYDELRPVQVVPLRPRPSYTRWLGVAAAVVGVGLLGVIVATAGSGGDEDDAGVAFESSAQDFDEAGAEAQRAATEAPAPASEAAEIADATEAAEATMAAPAGEAPAATAAGEPTEAPLPPELAADSAGGPIVTMPTLPFDPSVPIADDVALHTAGLQLIGQLNSTSPVPTPDSPCDDDPERPRTLLSEASYLREGVAVPILIAIDTTNANIIAVDPTTCEVIAVGVFP